jgi:Zn-dependent peptidase ImmA (M78 family)
MFLKGYYNSQMSKNKRFSMHDVKEAFEYRLQGSEKLKYMVSKTILLFPEKVIQRITKKCWIIGSMDDAWALTLQGKEIKNSEHLIFLTDELLKESEQQIQFTLAHEIGHVVLGHKNAILEHQTKAQIKKQEKEADEFAHKYIKK